MAGAQASIGPHVCTCRWSELDWSEIWSCSECIHFDSRSKAFPNCYMLRQISTLNLKWAHGNIFFPPFTIKVFANGGAARAAAAPFMRKGAVTCSPPRILQVTGAVSSNQKNPWLEPVPAALPRSAFLDAPLPGVTFVSGFGGELRADAARGAEGRPKDAGSERKLWGFGQAHW